MRGGLQGMASHGGVWGWLRGNRAHTHELPLAVARPHPSVTRTTRASTVSEGEREGGDTHTQNGQPHKG